MTRAVIAIAVGLLLAGCAPKTVDDAERRGDVPWLAAHGTPDAVQALGRVADKDPRAADALRARAETDIGVPIAAWHAHVRGAKWGTELLRAGLLDPKRAELTASAMIRRDPHLVDFVPDLEESLIRTGVSARGTSVPGLIATMGKPALAAVQRRLADGRSRGAMCRGLASADADPELRNLLFKLGPDARDEVACVDMIVAMAEKSDDVFKWLVKEGEPGILTAASRPTGFMCDKSRTLWSGIFEARTAKEYGGFAVPLSEALKRCPVDLDSPVSHLLKAKPESHFFVVSAIDPYGGALARMPLTCAQMAVIGGSHAHPLTRERAADAYRHGCLNGR